MTDEELVERCARAAEAECARVVQPLDGGTALWRRIARSVLAVVAAEPLPDSWFPQPADEDDDVRDLSGLRRLMQRPSPFSEAGGGDTPAEAHWCEYRTAMREIAAWLGFLPDPETGLYEDDVRGAVLDLIKRDRAAGEVAAGPPEPDDEEALTPVTLVPVDESEDEWPVVAAGPPKPHCDVYVRSSALRDGQTITIKHLGDDVYRDRNEYGDVVGVEILDATEVRINGVSVSPFPGKYRESVPVVAAGPGREAEPQRVLDQLHALEADVESRPPDPNPLAGDGLRPEDDLPGREQPGYVLYESGAPAEPVEPAEPPPTRMWWSDVWGAIVPDVDGRLWAYNVQYASLDGHLEGLPDDAVEFAAPGTVPDVREAAEELLVRLHLALEAVNGADSGLYDATAELIGRLAVLHECDLAVADVFARALVGQTTEEGT